MRYLMTAILSFVIDYGLFIWFFNLLSHPWKAIIAVVAARVISGILNYLMNRFYTFKANVRWVKSSGQYFLLFLLILAASAVFTDMLIYLGVPHPLAKVLVDSILFFISFRVQKRWIFST
jgi:putative flippase GtrA